MVLSVRKNYVERIVELKFGAEGASTNSTAYVTIANSDISLDPSKYRGLDGKLYLRFIAHIKNALTTGTTYIVIYRQNKASTVAGTELKSAGDWAIVDSGWIDWSTESGYESYQIRLKTTTNGTAYYNSAIMILSPSTF